MRHITTILITLIICHTNAKANKIDLLKTDKEVEDFISSVYQKTYNVNYNYYKFKLNKPDSIHHYVPCDSTIKLQPSSWKKLDFNNDGLTDLFTTIYTYYGDFPSYTVYVVIDQGNNHFQLNQIPSYHILNCYSVKQITINNLPCLVYKHFKTEDTTVNTPEGDTNKINQFQPPRVNYFQVAYIDTLVYKFGGFIELNKQNLFSPNIKSIYFETGPCLGSCPIINLNIFKDGAAYYTRHENMEQSNGNFRGIIKPNHLNEIMGLIRYLNVETLQNVYSTSSTDQPSSKLIVYFSNGTAKEIMDDGLQGTMGLVRLYELLLALRGNQKWK